MRRYRLIEHTADIGLIAYGASLPEAFANAAYGMFSIIANLRPVREVESRAVEVTAGDPESLLFEWLNHLIYIFEVDNLLLKRFDVTRLTDHELRATCYGEKVDTNRHHLKIGIKSATYHKLVVDKARNRVQVIFDI